MTGVRFYISSRLVKEVVSLGGMSRARSRQRFGEAGRSSNSRNARMATIAEEPN
jgi:hypothetical protein